MNIHMSIHINMNISMNISMSMNISLSMNIIITLPAKKVISIRVLKTRKVRIFPALNSGARLE